jgi:hypothetical protein
MTRFGSPFAALVQDRNVTFTLCVAEPGKWLWPTSRDGNDRARPLTAGHD